MAERVTDTVRSDAGDLSSPRAGEHLSALGVVNGLRRGSQPGVGHVLDRDGFSGSSCQLTVLGSVGLCVVSYERIQDDMDAFLFARPAVPVLPAFHPLERPLGGAAHGALRPLIGCRFADGLPDAVD